MRDCALISNIPWLKLKLINDRAIGLCRIELQMISFDASQLGRYCPPSYSFEGNF